MEIVTFMKKGKRYQYRRVTEKSVDIPAETKSVCFTGHRPKNLNGYVSLKEYQWIIDMIMFEVFNQYDNGVRRFITGGAQGIDQLAYRAVRQAIQVKKLTDIINTIYVPFEGQEANWMDTGSFGKLQYYNMIDTADEILLVNKRVTAQSPYYDIVKALEERNKCMLRDSVRLLAWYDGHSTGGTFNCIRDAITLGMEVVYLTA